MSTFAPPIKHHVWLRPVGKRCKVRVDGEHAANWVRVRIAPDFQGEEIVPVPGTDHACFHVALESREDLVALEGAIRSLRGIELMLDPA